MALCAMRSGSMVIEIMIKGNIHASHMRLGLATAIHSSIPIDGGKVSSIGSNLNY